MIPESAVEKYFLLLKSYIESPEDIHLFSAAKLGRELLMAETSPDEIADLHKLALIRLAEKSPNVTLLEAVRTTSAPLRELLMAHGIAFRLKLESEKRMKVLIEKTDGLIGISDENNTITYVSPSVRNLDYSPTEIIGKAPSDFVHTDDVSILEDSLARAAKHPNQSIRMDDIRVRRKDGSYIHMEGIMTNLIDQAGVNGIVFNGRDITDRKLAEEKLWEEREKFRTIFENVTDVIVYVDKLGRILEVNKKIEDLIGYRSEELIGRQFMNLGLFRLKHVPKLIKLFADAVIRGEILDTTGKGFNIMELEVNDKPGNSVAVEVSTTSVKKDGKLQGFLSIIHDISERKRAELELQKAHNELEKRVEKRTAELKSTYNQLLHTEKLSAVGKLSASIAHEFNNPLFGIRNVLGGIKRRASLDEDDAELVDMALQECDRIKYLIQDLQDLNRPTSGIMAPADVHKAIDNVLLLVKNEFAKKKIRAEKHYDPNLPKILAVSDQIKQVLLNLIRNGGDAIQNDGGTVTITTELLDENMVAIHIHDSGVGIKPEDKDQIFEPFFTTKKDVKDTGLGLSVSYGIIKRHKGKIEVESQVGQGSTFTIILPIDGGKQRT